MFNPGIRPPRGVAAARLPLSAGSAAIDRYLLHAGPTAANPQHRHAAAGRDKRTDDRQMRIDARAALTGKHDTLVRRAPGWQGAPDGQQAKN